MWSPHTSVTRARFPWDIHRLNQVLVGLYSYCSVADVVRVYKVIVEVNYRTKPTVVVTAPSGTVTTSSPTIAWTYTQTEGDAQAASQVRLFTATQVTDVAFAPDTAAAVYAYDSTGDLSSILLPTSINSDSYWVYVRSQSTFGSWSSWASRQFVVSAPGPASPGVADVSGVYPAGVGVIEVIPDAVSGSAWLTLRDTSNLISASEADAEVLSDWVAIDTTNVGNHARDTTQGFGNSTSSWKITAAGAGDMAIISDWVEVAADTPVTARTQFKAATTGRSCRVRVLFFDNSYTSVGGTLTGSSVSDSTSSWTEATVTGTSPAGATLARVYSEVLSAGASEVHNVDRVGLSHGASVPWSDGGMAARNLLSAWYSTAEGGAPVGESWTPGTASSTGTNGATGTGYSGGSSHKMTYIGLTPSIAFRAASTTFNSATSGTDFTLNKPAGTASGDLMLAALTTNESSLTLTPPAGWDLVNTASINDGSDDSVLYVLKRTAGGSEPSTWTDGFLSATCTRRTALVVAYSGAADAALQFVGEGSSATSSDAPTYVTSPTVNNTDPNAWRVSAFAGRDDATGGALVANTQAPGAVPPIAFVSAAAIWGSVSTGTAYTINRPAGVVTGDLMIATLHMTRTVTVTAPAGWTIQYQAQGTQSTHCVLSRIAGASEPASWSSTVSGTTDHTRVTQCVAYRYVNTTTPFIATSGKVANGSSTITSNSITNTDSRAWRVLSLAASSTAVTGNLVTSSEVAERCDGGYTYDYVWNPEDESTFVSMHDSNGPVTTGSHAQSGTFAASVLTAGAWIGLLNPLASPPSGVANETSRTSVTVGSSDPWMTVGMFDSNGVAATGTQSVTGIFTPGSGTAWDSGAGWVGLIRPAAPVTAGYVVANMATTVDVSSVPTDVIPSTDASRMTAQASFLGSTAGTAYLTMYFYRANQLISSVTKQGVSFSTSTWAKSYATFDVPDGTTRVTLGVSAADRAVSDYVLFDHVSIAFGSSAVYRTGTSRGAHAVWSVPQIQYVDDGGAGYGEWTDLPGQSLNPPAFDPLSGLATYTDHTSAALISRKYRARTVAYGLAGDRFVSAWGPESPVFSFSATKWWLKSLANPADNIELLVKWDAFNVNTTNTATPFQALGEDLPTVLTEGFKGRSFPVTLIPVDRTKWALLQEMLNSGQTLFLQTDVDIAMFVRPVGDISAALLATNKRRTTPLREVTISFVEVAAVP